MERLTLTDFNETLVLHGTGLAAPWRGALRALPEGGLETIDVLLEGPPADLNAALSGAAALLGRISAGPPGPSSPALYLGLTAYRGAPERWTRVTAGRLALLAGGMDDLAAGRVVARLTLSRGAGWEAEERALPLSNLAGAGVMDGLAVSNHADAGHENGVNLAAADAAGDLPAELCITLKNTLGLDSLGDVYIAQVLGANPGSRAIEAEAGGGVLTASAEASGGSYTRVTLPANSASPVTLLTWNLSQADVDRWAGEDLPSIQSEGLPSRQSEGLPSRQSEGLRPLARCFAAPNYADLWLWWRLTAGNQSWETGRVLAASSLMQELPLIHLSPGVQASPAAVTLELRAMGNGISAYNLDLDFIHFYPAGRLVKYRAIGTVAAGASLRDEYGQVASIGADGRRVHSHTRLGGGLMLEPGQDQRFCVLHSGKIDHGLAVEIHYRPRYWGG